MEDRAPDQYYSSTSSARSRWTPKPEQIQILEAIFNSGMVNPPKDETVRIRKMLEEFGSVGDANVFYWFQNRRSRSRRQQRQARNHGAINNFEPTGPSSSASSSLSPVPFPVPDHPPLSGGGAINDYNVLSISDPSYPSHQLGVHEINEQCGSSSKPMLNPYDPTTTLQYSHPGYIIVYINEVPTEVPRGPFDMKAMFGQDFMLVHPSGLPVPCTNHGIILQSLQPGEKYFLVPKPT